MIYWKFFEQLIVNFYDVTAEPLLEASWYVPGMVGGGGE